MSWTYYADFTQPSVPSGINGSRSAATSPIYPVTNGGTTLGAAVNSGPIYEDRGGGLPGGWWSFKGYTNGLPDAFNLTAAGWVNYLSNTSAAIVNGQVGPDGACAVYSVTVVNADASAFRYLTPAGDPWAVFSGSTQIWVRDPESNIGTNGFLSGDFPLQLGNWIQKSFNLGSGRTWRRVANTSQNTPRQNNGNVAGGSVLTIYPSTKNGLQEFPYPYPGTPALDSALGSVEVAAAQLTSDADWYRAHTLTDLPLVNGSTGGTLWQLATPANLIQSGDLDVQISFIPGWQDCIGMRGPVNPHGGANPTFHMYMFYAVTPEGECSLRFDDSGSESWILRVRGVDVLTLTGSNHCPMFANNDQELTIRAWYKPNTTGQCGLRFTVNGAFQPAETGSTTGGALQAPTSVTLMQNPDAAAPWQTPGMLTEFGVYSAGSSTADPAPSGVIVALGDSLMRSNPMRVAASSYIWTANEIRAGTRQPIATLAIGGATTLQQKTTWDASSYKGNANVAYVVCNVGINDLNQASPADSATLISRIQSLIDDVRAANPDAKVLYCQLTPAYGYWTTQYGGAGADTREATRQAVNTALSNGTITGVDKLVTSHVATLTAADGKSMKDEYNTGSGLSGPDGLHDNSFGMRARGAAIRQGILDLIAAQPPPRLAQSSSISVRRGVLEPGAHSLGAGAGSDAGPGGFRSKVGIGR